MSRGWERGRRGFAGGMRERGSPAKKKLEGDRYRDSAKPRPGQRGKAQKGRLQGQQGSGESDQREAVKIKENE